MNFKLCLLFFLIITADAQFEKPIQIIDISHDSELVELVYPFKNDTNEVVKFSHIRADCNCIKAKIFPEEASVSGFKPSEMGAIKILMTCGKIINEASIYAVFESNTHTRIFKLKARLIRQPELAFSTDKLFISPISSEKYSEVKLLSGTLDGFSLNYDSKVIDARIDKNSIYVRSLRNSSSKDFIEVVSSVDGKNIIAGVLEVNYEDFPLK